MTRAHVRLLGPCFKTGQVDTDLLAIDCSSTHRYHRQHRRTTDTVFPCKTQKGLHKRHISTAELYAPISCKPCIGREIEPVSMLRAAPKRLQATSYNTGIHYESVSSYLLATFAYGRPSCLTGHGFSTGLKKCTARQWHELPSAPAL